MAKSTKGTETPGETFHRAVRFSQMSLGEVDSHQSKCSILTARVSLSDRCLQSEPRRCGYAAACGGKCEKHHGFLALLSTGTEEMPCEVTQR